MVVRATKSVNQPVESEPLRNLLAECLNLTYNAILYAEENGITNRKGMKGFYRSMKEVRLPSCFKVAIIARACSVVESRRKSQRRRTNPQHRKPLRQVVCITSGFFVTAKGRLFIPLQRRNDYADVLLNHGVRERIEGRDLRSLTITPDSISICYSQEIGALPVKRVYGLDRNEKNLTFGNHEKVFQLDLSKTVKVRQATREVLASFKRADVRVRGTLARKYWRRANHRIDQILHASTNLVVEEAAKDGAALALEDLTGIRTMYRRGNGQGSEYRFRLNSWPYRKAYRMLEYKSAWRGVTIIPLTKAETYGSSSKCASCGEGLHAPDREDAEHRRMLWCRSCKAWVERDVNAAMNLSERGLARFVSSLPPGSEGEKGPAGEAMRGNGTKTLILRVDAGKSGCRIPTEDWTEPTSPCTARPSSSRREASRGRPRACAPS